MPPRPPCLTVRVGRSHDYGYFPFMEIPQLITCKSSVIMARSWPGHGVFSQCASPRRRALGKAVKWYGEDRPRPTPTALHRAASYIAEALIS